LLGGANTTIDAEEQGGTTEYNLVALHIGTKKVGKPDGVTARVGQCKSNVDSKKKGKTKT